MPLKSELDALVAPEARKRLRARGLARGLVWREGQLPIDAPKFDAFLSERLEEYSFRILAALTRKGENDAPPALIREAFAVAGELLESSHRRNSRAEPDRGHHLLLAALCYELAGYSARAFTSLAEELDGLNLTSLERVVALVLRRQMSDAIALAVSIIGKADAKEESLIKDMEAGEASLPEAVDFAATVSATREIAAFVRGYLSGDAPLQESAAENLSGLAEGLNQASLGTKWWVVWLLANVMRRMAKNNLHHSFQLAKFDAPTGRAFIELMAAQVRSRIDVWPSQVKALQAALELEGNVLISLPTSAGKTRVAEIAIIRALSQGKRVVYTTPLRALSAYFERHFSNIFGPLGYKVSAMYGAAGVTEPDMAALQGFDLIIATPEKLDFACRADETALKEVGLIVLDEGHMIGQGTREIRYELLVQRLLSLGDAASRRLLCLSAVLPADGSYDQFAEWMTAGRTAGAIKSIWRPTRRRTGILAFNNGNGRLLLRVGQERPFLNRFVESRPGAGRRRRPFPANDRQELVTASALRLILDGHTVLVYCPVRAHAESLAKKMVELIDAHQIGPVEGIRIEPEEIAIAREWLGGTHPAFLALCQGIGVHHAHMPAPVLRLIEKLLEEKRLRLVLASPTVSQGLDLPYSAVVFHSLTRFSAVTDRQETIPTQEFINVVGRVGRAFIDMEGLVIFPVVDDAGGVRDAALFDKLCEAQAGNPLESGLLSSVASVVTPLTIEARRTGRTLEEWIDDFEAAWTPHSVAGALSSLPTTQAAVEALDVAILALGVADAPSPVEAGAAISERLRGSLFLRQIEDNDRLGSLWGRIMGSRLSYVWAHSTPRQRRGAYRAGLPWGVSTEIQAELPQLVQELQQAEAAFQVSDGHELARSVMAMATRIWGRGPFKGPDLEVDWRPILGGWLQGAPLSDLSVANPSDIIPTVSEAFTYQLVWALEAIRGMAVEGGLVEENELSGSVGLALTYGVPGAAAAHLLRFGLESRSLAMKMSALEPYPELFGGYHAWLDALDVLASEELKGDEALLWRRFRKATTSRRSREWVRASFLVERLGVASDFPDVPLWVLPSETQQGIYQVMTPRLEPLGEFDSGSGGTVGAFVEGRARDGRVAVARFGPGGT